MTDLQRLKHDQRFYDNLIHITPAGEYRTLLQFVNAALINAIEEKELEELNNPQGTAEDRYHK